MALRWGKKFEGKPAVGFEQVAKTEAAVAPLAKKQFTEGVALGPVGLALSGGGIRSATFCLGVLQSFAKHQMLSKIDYLSTVSGGGYIGSWLSAWIARETMANVEPALARCGSTQESYPSADEPAPVTWLRKYSNYLAPRLGLLSVDSLTLISIWVRNVLLNLVIAISFFVALLLLPKVLVAGVPWLVKLSGLDYVAYVAGLGILPVMICVNLSSVANAKSSTGLTAWLVKVRGVAVTVLIPGTVAAIAGSFVLFGNAQSSAHWYQIPVECWTGISVLAVVWVLVQFGMAWKGSGQITVGAFCKDLGSFLLAGLVVLGLMRGALLAEETVFFPYGANDYFDYIRLLVLGPPAFLVTFGLGGFVFVGLAGRAYYERSREWWSRLNAWFFLIGTAWFLLTATSMYAGPFTRWALSASGSWFKALAGIGWVGSLLTSLLGSRVKNLSSTAQINLMAVLNGAAYIAIIGLLIGIAALNDRILEQWAPRKAVAIEHTEIQRQELTGVSGASTSSSNATTTTSKQVNPLDEELHKSAKTLKALNENPVWLGVPVQDCAFVICVFVLGLFGWRVDVNKFSLHNMYKNRLIRAYLGASRKRKPQPFDGFDEDDDMPLTKLAQQRPFHILNTAMNLSQGENLAWQERKAASFVLTPEYCGFALGKTQGDSGEDSTRRADTATRTVDASCANRVEAGMPSFKAEPGYQPTKAYGAEDERSDHCLTLGTAMATSGAAVSPTMGALTRPALAFVLTLFNARLGRWMANPIKKNVWIKRGPNFGLICYLQELFGWSNEKRNFVYLSDGGHFDNLGLYELVRRRCSTIWVVDASADPARVCEDLGKAIRQCRVDFGVEILLPLVTLNTTPPALYPKSGFAKGDIIYGGNHPNGTLIYIKPTMCDDRGEPDDVLSYSKRESKFPHQTTADQFFDESQFESYRRLGFHIAEQCLK